MLRRLLLLTLLLFTAATPATTLKIATLLPDGTGWMRAMRDAATEVAERTQGRVTLRFYPGGVMGNDKSVLRKIRAGQLHGGVLTSGGLVAVDTDIQLYSLPFLFRSFDEVDYVRERMDPLLIEGLRREGFVSYGLMEGGFAYLMTQTPISRVEELRQTKVWSPEGDRVALAAFEALNISPISLPLGDVLTGLQTGLIETISASPVAAIALQWHTAVKYLTDTPLLYLYGSLVIRERDLERLSPADRTVLAQVLEKASRQLNDANRRDNESARQVLQQRGILLITPSREELVHWQSIVGDAMESARQQGGGYSSHLLGKLRHHLNNLRNGQR